MTLNPDQHSPQQDRSPQELQPVTVRAWTPAQRERSRRKSRFLKALQEHGSIAAACLASGVHDTTVWRWRKQYPAFDKAVITFIEGVREQRLVESLYRIATSEDPRMANAATKAGEFLLKSWNREKYSDSLKIEQSMTVHQKIEVSIEVRDAFRAEQQARLTQLGLKKTIEG
ncbi:hypothetical protein [Deinococcus sp.]|uniref:helix-turn-helix domain-containing protein n=1 Tax=Deinococcus sp. TaxID=47478 RepID=UPI0025E640DE|nr:hypothetical protein [Deinococcus sp.]